MSMIDPVTLALVKSALDAGALRQLAHANNIANAGTPGYRPFAVRFEEGLGAVREALESGQGARLAAADIPAARLYAEAPATAATRLDAEVAASAGNALQYQALAHALGQQYALMNLAITGGSR